MTEQDNEYLERLYRGFALAGLLMNGHYTLEEIPNLAKRLAKTMMKESPITGIVAVKRSSTKKGVVNEEDN